MKYLITHSLLNSWLYWLDYKGDKEDDVKKSFENYLNKIYEDNIYMQAGREFEDLVRSVCNGEDTFLQDEALPIKQQRYSDNYKVCVYKVADEVRGGVWQVTGYKSVWVGNQEIIIYSKVDILRGPDIFDIKYTSKYEDIKYFNNTQHRMYFECFPGTERFIYLISDGKEVYREIYYPDESQDIINTISDFWSWINQFDEYKTAYFDNWKSKY